MTGPTARPPVSDFPRPYSQQFQGRAWARALLQRLGWRVDFDGLPGAQGVIAVYPHTSNWDFIVMVLAKWALGVPVCFWGKDTLFRVPLLGIWLRYLGGVPVDRHSAHGVVVQAVRLMREHKALGRYFWLALAPEGTRRACAGLRSGFYRTAVGAGVPLCLVRLDYARRHITVTDFIALSGDESRDMARVAAIYADVRGLYPENAAPVRLLGSPS